VRLFAYGFLSVTLVLYLAQVGLAEGQIGLLLTLTLVGDTAISLWITTNADRLGRRRMLLAGAGLMIFAGILFVLTKNFYLLLLAAMIGVISPSGNEVGPFLSIEQAGLSHLIPDQRRTQVFSWYNLVGSFATALGALAGGLGAQALQGQGYAAEASYRAVIIGYAVLGAVLVILFLRLSPAVEVTAEAASGAAPAKAFLGLHRSKGVIFRLAALFSLDALAGGFVIQSLVAYWFHLRFGVEPGVLGSIFFGANILAGISALSAAWVAKHWLDHDGVHAPAEHPADPGAVHADTAAGDLMLLLRFSISQMDADAAIVYYGSGGAR
jgi:MFS family permease